MKEVFPEIEGKWVQGTKRTFELTKPIVIHSRGHRIEVPIGFLTDFASVPRFFWRIFPPWDTHRLSAVVHDYLCVSSEVPRKEADLIFLDLMQRQGVSWWKRTVMYRAVRTYAVLTRKK